MAGGWTGPGEGGQTSYNNLSRILTPLSGWPSIRPVCWPVPMQVMIGLPEVEENSLSIGELCLLLFFHQDWSAVTTCQFLL